MFEMMAMHWYEAEKIANVDHGPCWPAWAELPKGRRDVILKRVQDVLDGEVRRSECGPGDLAIWHGRLRTLPTRRLGQGMEVGVVYDSRYANFYDSMSLLPEYHVPCFGTYKTQNHTRLFGNSNVGQLDRCNLQVAGQLVSDQIWENKFWYADTQVYSDMADVLEYVFSKAVVTLVVGDRPSFQKKLIELIRWPQPAEVFIPVRQSFCMEVAFFGDALPTLFAELKKRDPEREQRLFLHTEGWRTRTVA